MSARAPAASGLAFERHGVAAVEPAADFDASGRHRPGGSRWRPAPVLALAFVSGAALAQEGGRPSGAGSPDGPTPFKQLRFEEDYRYLADPARRTGFWDGAKYIRLGPDPGTYLSSGGELRERYQYYARPDFGLGGAPARESYLWQRLLLHADLHAGPWRAFVQFGSHFAFGKATPLAPSDEDRLDLQQGFLDYAFDTGSLGRVTFRGGRQELLFGSSRLVSVREGPNVRQSFDGGRATLTSGGATRFDAFLVRPVRNTPGVFDTRSDPGRAFWGAYASALPVPGVPGARLDFYYLGLDRAEAEFDRGTARETRHTVGARLFGAAGPVDYNFEAAWQWGRFGQAGIQAWTVASDTGWTLQGLPLSPRLGFKANVASGDRNPRDGALGTFNPLFPRGSYFTEAAINAPANLIDANPNLTLALAEDVRLTLGADFVWRQSTRNAFYAQPSSPLIPGNAGRARFVGVQMQALLEWEVSRNLEVNAAYVRFQRGAFIRQAGGRSTDYLGAWAAYRF